MILGLSDILTAQQLEKPQAQLAREGRNIVDSLFKAQDKTSFKDVLSTIPEKPINNNSNNDVVTTKPSDNIITYKNNAAIAPKDTNNSSSAKSEEINTNDNNTDTSHTKATSDDAQNTDNTADANATNTNTISLKDLKDAVDKLQQDGANLSPDVISKLNEIFPKLIQQGLPQNASAEDVVNQIVAKIQEYNNISSDSGNIVEDILSKMNFAKNKTNNLTAEEIAAQVLSTQKTNNIDIAKIAPTILEAAKKEAEKPQILEADLKSVQLLGLNKIDKEEDSGGLKEVNIFSNNPTKPETTSTQNKNDKIINLTNKLGQVLQFNNGEISDQLQQSRNVNAANYLSSLQNNRQAGVSSGLDVNNIQQNQNVVGAPQPQIATFTDNQQAQFESSDKNIGTYSSNFVKFQNIMQNAQNGINALQNNRLGKTEEIIAQIKFGLINSANKDNQNISVQLHPKDLGKVDIKMDIANDGKTNVTIIAEKTDTLNLLQKDASSLKDMLTDALKTDSGNLNFSFHEQGNGDWQPYEKGNNFANNIINNQNVNNVGPAYLTAQSYRNTLIATEGLDIRV